MGETGNSSAQPLFQFCALPFTDINIAHTGQIIQCCFDSRYKTDICSIKKTNLRAAWSHSSFVNLREMLLKGLRKNSDLCSKCDFDGYRDIFQEDNRFLRTDMVMEEMEVIMNRFEAGEMDNV